MATPTSAGFRRAIRSAAKATSSELTDRELLGRFTAEADEASFAALVGRHDGMVLGVCRRALPTIQDAEDACQATFLILAQKAGSVRWQASVANWLYTTARRVAARVRITAERRARREGRAAVPEAVAPVDQMTGRELLAALDEELDRLSPTYREPLVLCHLEGLSREEAAARLGVTASALKSRLERGRKKLGDALTKRGVVLGAGLLMLAVTSPARASSPRLVQSILAAASGSVPAAVAELVKGVTVNGIITRGVLALAAVLAVVGLGVGLGSLTSLAADQPTPPAAGKGQPKAPSDAPKETTVAGLVLDAAGKPLAGARILLLGRVGEPADLGTSATDGRFKVKVPGDRRGLHLIARAEGSGVGFVRLGTDADAEVELRTVKDHPIRGRVVDTQGKPVAAARVVATRISVYADNSLDDFLAGWKTRAPVRPGLPPQGRGEPRAERILGREAGVLPEVKTDADGRFTIAEAGVERLVALRISGVGIADDEVWVVNRDDFDPKPYNEATAKMIAASQVVTPSLRRLLHGPAPSIIAEAEKPVRGVVTDADSGKPRAGVTVWLTREGRDPLPLPLSAKTDAEGRYQIRGARKATAYGIEVVSDPDTRHVGTHVQSTDTAGFEPVVADIKVKKGVVVTGKVIDAETKKPLRGYAMVSVLADNPFVKDYPSFDTMSGDRLGVTAEDGTFRVVTIPGPVLLMGGAYEDPTGQNLYKKAVPAPKYPQYFDKRRPTFFTGSGVIGLLQGHFCKVLEVKADAEVVEQDVLVEPLP